jgi:Holliday junction resolvasome RuvABC endonuclease subunit
VYGDTVPIDPDWCGIDPGLSGAIAFIGPTGLGAHVYPMPLVDVGGQDELDNGLFEQYLESHSPDLVCTERPQGFGGCSAAFKLGQNLGGLIVATLSAHFRLERVRPQTWQAIMLPGIHGRDNLKRASVARAKALFPTVKFHKHGRTKPDDLADALLIAAYARLTFGGIAP